MDRSESQLNIPTTTEGVPIEQESQPETTEQETQIELQSEATEQETHIEDQPEATDHQDTQIEPQPEANDLGTQTVIAAQEPQPEGLEQESQTEATAQELKSEGTEEETQTETMGTQQVPETETTLESQPVASGQTSVAASWNSARDMIFYMNRFRLRLVRSLLAFFLPSMYFVYRQWPLSPENEKLLADIGRKTLILDLDETLIHACYVNPISQQPVGFEQVPTDAKPDFKVDINLEGMNVKFLIFKRPNVDEFLEFVAEWYDLAIYTASLEAYASPVTDLLDAKRGILSRRFYRQHCRSSTTGISKDLNVVNGDMTRTFILDDSPHAYRYFQDNALYIKSWYYDPKDKELSKLLPFLDALRFAKDVRSILNRRAQS